MLMKMTGESSAAQGAASQDNTPRQPMTESYDLGVMPELAFDFSLPFDDSNMSFDPPYLNSDMRAW